MDVKALVLSGGTGSRLRPITHTNAKQLVPVANKPVLFFGLEAIRDSGIKETGIIVGDTEPEIRAAVEDGSRWNLNVSYIRQNAPMGLAHAVLTAEEYLKSSPFVMYLGDNIIRRGIKDIVKSFIDSGADASILLAHVRNPERFGVATVKDNAVINLEEKPEKPASDLALVGVYMFNSTIFEASRAIEPSWRNELEITDALQWLIDNGFRVDYSIVDGWWKDTGKLEDLLEANRIVLSEIEEFNEGLLDDSTIIHGNVIIEHGTRVIGSTIRGPAIIGKDCIIENSFIGPFTSIGNCTTVTNSEIEHSIAMEMCVIEDTGTMIQDSLLGKNALVTRSKKKPKAIRFMLGDNSTVELQ